MSKNNGENVEMAGISNQQASKWQWRNRICSARQLGGMDLRKQHAAQRALSRLRKRRINMFSDIARLCGIGNAAYARSFRVFALARRRAMARHGARRHNMASACFCIFARHVLFSVACFHATRRASTRSAACDARRSGARCAAFVLADMATASAAAASFGKTAMRAVVRDAWFSGRISKRQINAGARGRRGGSAKTNRQ
jgi:hypothetical protein